MPIRHTVVSGEGIATLSLRYGFSPDRIWSDPANAALRQSRPNPNALLPGDVVTIPDRRIRAESVGTGSRHVFVRRGVPALFRLQMLDDGQPRSGLSYALRIDAIELRGVTDGDGRLEHFVPNDARSGTIVFGDDEEYELDFGTLDPLATLTGAQKRLTNLGFPCTDEIGTLGALTREALRSFQRRVGLKVTGDLDAATTDRLGALHDTKDVFTGGGSAEHENDRLIPGT